MEAVERRLTRALSRAILDFGMLADGDRVMVCVSGGKDSYTMLHLLRELSRRAPIRFELVVVNVDQGHPGYPADRLRVYMREENYDFRMIEEDTYSIVTEKIPEGKTYCSLCSRLRRGILYGAARAHGCTKIALGHHRDDLIESLLMSMLFGGKIRSMPPRLRSDDGENVVIRPLCYAAEADIAAFAREMRFPVIPCDLCGSQENLMRRRVKDLLSTLEIQHPGVRASLLGAMGNVMPAHLLDRRLQREERGPDPWIDGDDCEAPAPVALRSSATHPAAGFTRRRKPNLAT
jgi:tRNA 2-thiocytidine biosynthesis protein TtcA